LVVRVRRPGPGRGCRGDALRARAVGRERLHRRRKATTSKPGHAERAKAEAREALKQGSVPVVARFSDWMQVHKIDVIAAVVGVIGVILIAKGVTIA
jgi:hypothetical protein